MNKALRYKLLFMAAFVTGCLFLLGCENDPAEVNRLGRIEEIPEEARDVTAFFSQQGTMKAKLTAPLMLRYQHDSVYTEFPNTLHVDFYDAAGSIESYVDALYGKYFERQNKVLLRDSVVVINLKGDTLWTSELWWDQQQEKFYTDKPARYHTPQHKITGNHGMDANQDLSGVIFHQPTGTIVVEDSLMN